MLDRPSVDSRAARTRTAIVEAFIKLVLDSRYNTIRISDLIATANVGKSTFYEHFGGKSDVLLAAMQPVTLALATAASGRAARSYVQQMVRHLWERRWTGRLLMGSMTSPIIQRQLADAIRPHVEREGWPANASVILASGVAAAQLAMLRSWFAGEAASTIEDMTDRLIACAWVYDRNSISAPSDMAGLIP